MGTSVENLGMHVEFSSGFRRHANSASLEHAMLISGGLRKGKTSKSSRDLIELIDRWKFSSF
jgi:hypothetical protein